MTDSELVADSVLVATVPSPAGDLAVLVHDDVLVACGFGTPEEQYARLRTPPPLRHVNDLGPFSAALSAYFAGDLTAMNELPVDQHGGPFQQAAWKVMRGIEPGTTITYAELAARAGSPLAARAAGSACAINLIAPIVPCHRVLRGGGALGGYAYGLSRKEGVAPRQRGASEARSAATPTACRARSGCSRTSGSLRRRASRARSGPASRAPRRRGAWRRRGCPARRLPDRLPRPPSSARGRGFRRAAGRRRAAAQRSRGSSRGIAVARSARSPAARHRRETSGPARALPSSRAGRHPHRPGTARTGPARPRRGRRGRQR